MLELTVIIPVSGTWQILRPSIDLPVAVRSLVRIFTLPGSSYDYGPYSRRPSNA